MTLALWSKSPTSFVSAALSEVGKINLVKIFSSDPPILVSKKASWSLLALKSLLSFNWVCQKSLKWSWRGIRQGSSQKNRKHPSHLKIEKKWMQGIRLKHRWRAQRRPEGKERSRGQEVQEGMPSSLGRGTFSVAAATTTPACAPRCWSQKPKGFLAHRSPSSYHTERH